MTEKRSYLSISSLVDFSRCPRRFYYKGILRLQDGPPHPALKFGEAIHKAFPITVLEGLRPGLEAFDSVWTDEHEAEGDDKRNRTRAKLMLADVEFTHKGSRSPFKLLEPPGGALEIEDSVSDYEVPFAIDIGLDVPLVGRVDGLVRWKSTGEKFGLELKTSQEVSGRLFDNFILNPQILGYTLALRTLTEEPIAGVVLEALRVSKTSRVETLPHPIRVEDHHLDSFVTWARWVGQQILECERRDLYPQDVSGCAPYSQFGTIGFPCEYGRLCSVPDPQGLYDTYQRGEKRPFVLPTKNGEPLS